MSEKFTRWDAADHLRSEQDIEAYLQACSEKNDPTLIVAVLGDVARACNMMKLSTDVGMTRAGLYKAFSGKGNPSFATVAKVADALGFRVGIVPK